MAENCIDDFLAADIARDCDNNPKGGIEVNAVAIAYKDIDFTATTVNATNKMLLDGLTLKSGASGYFIEGLKQVQGASFEEVVKEDAPDGFKHIFAGVVLSPSAANKLSLAALLSGEPYVIVIEKKWKGAADAEAFEVLGIGSGLYTGGDAAWNTKESNGVIKFSLASQDGYEESKMPVNLLETDYATTKTAFENKFASA